MKIRAITMVVLVGTAACQNLVQGVDYRVDQQHDWPNQLDAVSSIQLLGPIVQEFTPAIGALDVVEIWKRARRVSLWLIGWGLAALATVAPAFGVLSFFWLFPMGLAAPFGASGWTSRLATNVTVIVGWCLYLALSVYGLRQRQRARYVVAYGVLIGLLILNVAGCRYEVAHIHIG